MLKDRLILLALLVLTGGASLTPARLAFADPDSKETPESVLDEKRTATEIPTKRKLPTVQAVTVKPRVTDLEIQSRLNKIAQSQDVFKKVHVDVIEGIVTVKGEVEEESYAKSFSALCEKVQGVIGVVDQMKITNVKKQGLRLAQSELQDMTQKFFKFIPYLLSGFVIMSLTLLFGYGIYRLWLIILMRRMAAKPVIARNLAKILSVPVYVLGFYLMLQVGGMGGLAATLVGGTGMLGIILGLAAKNIIENVLSSFMLTLRNPFQVGDDVVIGSESGIVYSLNSRCTMLLSSDGILTQIPNSVVLGATIKNVSSHAVNRTTFPFSVDREQYSEFPEIFREAVAKLGKAILADPAPSVNATSVTAARVTFLCAFWVDTKTASATTVKSNLLQTLLLLLEESKVSRLKEPEKKNEAATQLVLKRQSLEKALKPDVPCRSEKDVLASRRGEVIDPETAKPVSM